MKTPVAGGGVLHPVALGAMVVLALNDHWLKAAWPGVVTGKLSDVAGLVYAPLVLQACWELVRARRGCGWAPSRAVLVVAALATGLAFALVKSSPAAAGLYRVTFGVLRWPLDALPALVTGAPLPPLSKVMLTRDVTDLLALPAVAIAVGLGWARAAPTRAGGTTATAEPSDVEAGSAGCQRSFARGADGSEAMVTSSVAGASQS